MSRPLGLPPRRVEDNQALVHKHANDVQGRYRGERCLPVDEYRCEVPLIQGCTQYRLGQVGVGVNEIAV